MGLIREWLLGVTCAAMVLALAETVAPEGGVKRVCRLAGGLVLLLAVIQPVMKLDEVAMLQAMAEYRVTAQEYSSALDEKNNLIYETIIEEDAAAYIVDKAEQLGISCQAEVTFEYDGDGIPSPDTVTVRGDWTDEQCRQLSQILATDLGIPAARQNFERIQP